MPLMDEFKEEREALKHGTPKQKLSYFWDYYKWHTVAVITVILVLIFTVREIVTHKDVAFYACFLNLAPYDYPSDEAESVGAFAAYAGIDTGKHKVLFDTSIQIGMGTGTDSVSSQKLLAYVMAAEVDVMASDLDSILNYAYQGDFSDLRNLLSEEQLAAYQDSFYYIDGAVLAEIKAARESNDLAYSPVYPDPLQPGRMQDPIPAGVLLGDDNPLAKDYYFYEKQGAVSVMTNTARPELALKFLDFAMQETAPQ